MIDEKKQKAIELALKQIDKAFGKGALVRLGDKQVEKIDSISTGSLGLDMALGIGGVPKGRIIEIYGPESSGKTTLSLQIVAECQRNQGIRLINLKENQKVATISIVDKEEPEDEKVVDKLEEQTVNLENNSENNPETQGQNESN